MTTLGLPRGLREAAMRETRREFAVGEHDWHSADYVDWWIERDEGREAERRERLRAMLAAAPFAREASVAVLDVGGGYGVLTEEVLAAFPRARVTLADYSRPMLAQARRRLSRHKARIRFVAADLRDPGWTQAAGGPFDLAVSAIAIHNLRDLALIAQCYRGIAQVLQPGGLFLDYDLFDIAGGLARHEEMLREVGFARTLCLWQQRPAATLAAYADPA
jgi:ubiquinone/menaquinone biosynthesis C-methylase UbiE